MPTQKNTTLLECILVPPKIQKGFFLYQITSRAPVSISTSLYLNVPIIRGILLHGTIDNLCLKLHEEKEDVNFLRLSHRRGWIYSSNQRQTAWLDQNHLFHIIRKTCSHPRQDINDTSNSLHVVFVLS